MPVWKLSTQHGSDTGSLSPGRRVLAWSVWPATLAASAAVIAALDAVGLAAARDAMYVVDAVLLTASMVLAYRAAHQSWLDSLMFALFTLMFVASPLAFLLAWWLSSSDQHFGAVSAVVAGTSWLIVGIVTMLLSADWGDRYGPGGWAP